MTTTGWSALVYGRTLHMDFRHIALPEDFDRRARDWAETFILTSMRTPEDLSTSGPRWSFFRDTEHAVLGATLMAHQLTASDPTAPRAAMVRDVYGRPLYVFVGYVAAIGDAQPLAVPRLADLSPALFAPLYAHVESVWTVQSFEPAAQEPIRVPYRPLAELASLAEMAEDDATDAADQALDGLPTRDAARPRIWPADDAADRSRVWRAATSARHPISVCLGLARERDALDGPFQNVVLGPTAAPLVAAEAAPSEPAEPAATQPAATAEAAPAGVPAAQDEAADWIGGRASARRSRPFARADAELLGALLAPQMPKAGAAALGAVLGWTLNASFWTALYGGAIGWLAAAIALELRRPPDTTARPASRTAPPSEPPSEPQEQAARGVRSDDWF